MRTSTYPRRYFNDRPWRAKCFFSSATTRYKNAGEPLARTALSANTRMAFHQSKSDTQSHIPAHFQCCRKVGVESPRAAAAAVAPPCGWVVGIRRGRSCSCSRRCSRRSRRYYSCRTDRSCPTKSSNLDPRRWGSQNNSMAADCSWPGNSHSGPPRCSSSGCTTGRGEGMQSSKYRKGFMVSFKPVSKPNDVKEEGKRTYAFATARLSRRAFPPSIVPWHSSIAFFCSFSSPNLTKP